MVTLDEIMNSTPKDMPGINAMMDNLVLGCATPNEQRAAYLKVVEAAEVLSFLLAKNPAILVELHKRAIGVVQNHLKTLSKKVN